MELGPTLARVDAIEEHFAHVRAAPSPAGPEGERRKYIYGDTPTWAFLEMVDRARIGPEDIFYDLGCGTGRLVLLAALFCRAAHGIELHPERLASAADALATLGSGNAAVRQEDLSAADLSNGTLFYSWWARFPEDLRRRVAERVARAQPGARIVAIEFPMQHPRIATVEERDQLWSLPTDVGGESSVRVFLQEVRA